MGHDVLLVAVENRFGVARLPITLNRAGCRISVLGDPGATVCRSRFIRRVIPCEKNAAKLMAALLHVLARWAGPKPWVIFTDEFSLTAAAGCRHEPWMAEIFPVDPAGAMADVILRKTAFMALARDAGLPIPPMRICQTLADAEAAGRELDFPLFFKRDIDTAGAGVIQVFNPAEIPNAFLRLCDCGPVLVQQMIHGPLAKANMLYWHGKPLCWSTAYALKTWPGKFGPSCVRQCLVDPQIDALVEHLGDLTGFHGLCGFDAIHDSKTGRFVVIEFNGRLTPHYHLGHHSGVDFASGISDFFSSRIRRQRPRIFGGKPALIYIFPQDVRRCIAEYDLKGLLKWLPGVSQKDIQWADANLLLFYLVDFLKIFPARLFDRFRPPAARKSRRSLELILGSMTHAQLISTLGQPLTEATAEAAKLVFRLGDGRDVHIALSDPSMSARVVSIDFSPAATEQPTAARA